MTTDWQSLPCSACSGSGWAQHFADEELQCRKCGGQGKLIASKEPNVNTTQVLKWLSANWSLVSGAIAAGLAAYTSSGSTRTALMAVAAYLLGHATSASPAVQTVKARIAKGRIS